MWIPLWLRSVFLQKPLGSMFSSAFNFFPSLYSLRWCGILGALCPYAIAIMCRPPPQPTVTANCPSMAAEVFCPWCIYQSTWGNAWEMFVNLLYQPWYICCHFTPLGPAFSWCPCDCKLSHLQWKNTMNLLGDDQGGIPTQKSNHSQCTPHGIHISRHVWLAMST